MLCYPPHCIAILFFSDTCPQFTLSYPSIGTYSCPGSNINYTCVANVTVTSSSNLVTIWSGSAFQCSASLNRTALLQAVLGAPQSPPFTPMSCGSLSAVTTNIASTCYTSVLTIPAVQALNGATVMCTSTDGTTQTVVGSDTLKIISELCTSCIIYISIHPISDHGPTDMVVHPISDHGPTDMVVHPISDHGPTTW